jgi:alkanesulfonate monooxygenase SsuD/methylene tetrahydromethanopterin reductase-like flavin-dependent oxidoreductase (luciferase family)
MRIDTNVLGAVFMPDAGDSGPAAVDRRYGKQDFADAFHSMVELGRIADEVGFDTFWYTEHHFQHEGYEVIPNQILLGAFTAALTERINFGQMFNIVPEWNPLRLAEDFAAADILTNGRMRFGVGRGTVPREMQTLGATIESTDNAMSVDAETLNRERFEEAMQLIKAAWYQERFNFQGEHFSAPPPGIPDRDSIVTHLSLVPTVMREVEIYQACTTPRTMAYIAAQGHIGVYNWVPLSGLQRSWEKHTALARAAGRAVEPGDEQLLVVAVTVGDTMEEAMAAARPGHQESGKLLAPYGRFRNYEPPAGLTETPATYSPSLEESMRQRIHVVGTPDIVAEQLAEVRDTLSVQRMSVTLESFGMTTAQIGEQFHRFAEEVAPLMGETMGSRVAAPVR